MNFYVNTHSLFPKCVKSKFWDCQFVWNSPKIRQQKLWGQYTPDPGRRVLTVPWGQKYFMEEVVEEELPCPTSLYKKTNCPLIWIKRKTHWLEKQEITIFCFDGIFFPVFSATSGTLEKSKIAAKCLTYNDIDVFKNLS